jgi:hypothetical protein
VSTVRISAMSDGTIRIFSPKGDTRLFDMLEPEAVQALIEITGADPSSTIERTETDNGVVLSVVEAEAESDWFEWMAG